MTEDELHDLLRAAAERYRPPPEPPLERIWSGVEARVFDRPVLALRPRRPWAVALRYAAVLIVGIGVGIALGRREGGKGEPDQAGAGPDGGRGGRNGVPTAFAAGPATLFVGVANNYLEQATALLIAVVGDLRSSGAIPAGTVSRAHDLLSTTRLLLDTSPPDPALHDLLEDLELVLAQVVRLPASRSGPEAALIRQTLDQREVLPRLTGLLADARTDY